MASLEASVFICLHHTGRNHFAIFTKMICTVFIKDTDGCRACRASRTLHFFRTCRFRTPQTLSLSCLECPKSRPPQMTESGDHGRPTRLRFYPYPRFRILLGGFRILLVLSCRPNGRSVMHPMRTRPRSSSQWMRLKR